MALSSSVQRLTPAVSPKDLCSQCAAFDLDDALRSNPRSPVRTVLEITRLDPDTCSFCRFLSGSMGQVPEGGLRNLIAVQSHVSITPLLDKIEAPILCIKPPAKNKLFEFFHIQSSLIFDSDGPMNRNLQPITPLIDDYTVIREWIDSCVNNHRCHEPCSVKKFDYDISVHNLKVIDCRNRLIGELPPNGSYVTLSYVWGKPDVKPADQQAGFDSLEPGILPPDLPRTIEDAIIVTLVLGFDYLWVDRYCLDNSSEDFHQQLQQMDRIYAGSMLTIIAAAGSSGSYGLPGVSRQRKVNQPFRMGQRTLDSTPLFCRDTLESTTWCTRGWTYQEGLLSTRRLVFTDTQLYFECQERFRMEGWMTPEHKFWRRSKQSTGSWFDIQTERDPGLFPSVKSNAMVVLSRIEAFSKRSLTYENDVLNAMLGVFASLRRADGLQHLWGVPYCDSDPCRRSIPPLKVSLRRFLSSLSWDVDSSARRRVGFPSWSWTGWVGPTRWGVGLTMVDNTRASRATPDTPCTVHLELEDGKIIDWETYQALYDSIKLHEGIQPTQIPSKYIHVRAYITRIMPLPLPQPGLSRCYLLECDPETFGTGSELTYVDVNPTAERLSNFLLDSCVLHLPWYPYYGHETEFHVLIVQCRGSHWERIGTGMTSILLETAPVKKVWDKIRLG
jgi:hypothetical protein